MGCTSSNVGQHEVSLVLPLTIDKGEAAAAPKKFHEVYNLKGKLGKGAFAQVHLAYKCSDGHALAVKITDLRGYHKEPSDVVDVRVKRAVEKEAAILRRVGAQEYCVRFVEDYLEGLLSYIVMERCDMTLLQALERSPELTEKTLARIIREMLLGISSVHQIGVVHRDVKPDNFLCSGENCTVKLCDFGLAELLPSGSAELKGVYGTAPFMSPEMLAASGYGAATDVWSLGVIGYVLMFGRFPYQPIETTAKAMKAAILAGVPAPSFKPKSSHDVGGQCRVSKNAHDFLLATLNRNKASRPSASACLAMPWFCEEADSDQWSMPSLRPMLYASKRAGAFDVRGNSPNEKPSGVDQLLRAAQPQSPSGSARVGGLRVRTDGRTHSELSVDSPSGRASHKLDRLDPVGHKFDKFDKSDTAGHKIDKLDSTLVQSGGVISNTSRISTATGSPSASYQSIPSRHGGRRPSTTSHDRS